MKIINRWTTGLFTAVVITTGTLGVSTLANTETTTEPTTLTTELTAESTTEVQVQEKISFEYYTITEEAVMNGWTCGAIDRCDSMDSNRISVYVYDPASIGKHKLNIIFGVSVQQFDLNVVYVDEYNQTLGVEVFTLDNNGEDDSLSSSRVFSQVFETYPPGTKYVKFSDITNIIYP